MDDYRSSISSRPAFARNSNSYSSTTGPIPVGNRTLKVITETMTSTTGGGGGTSPFGANAAQIRDARDREKKELSDLNDRLASYIEKVRFLEAQNRKLKADLDMLHGRKGKDTISIKTMYESEINEAKKIN